MAVDFFTLVTNADALLTVLGSLDTTIAYAILFAVYSLETGVAPVSFLPGNSLLFLCGTLTMTAVFAFGTLFAVLSVAAFVGNLLSYETGAFLGAQLYARRIRWIDPERLEIAHDFYERHGGKAIVAARFAPIVRAFVPLVAGAARMPRERFLLLSAIAAVLWIGTLLTAGRLFGGMPFVRENLSAITLFAFFCAVAGPVGVALAAKFGLKKRARR